MQFDRNEGLSSGETQTVRGAEYPEGNVAGYGAGQQQDEEDGP